MHIITGQSSKIRLDLPAAVCEKTNLQIVAPITLFLRQRDIDFGGYTYVTRPPKKESTEAFFVRDVWTLHTTPSGNTTRLTSVRTFVIS